MSVFHHRAFHNSIVVGKYLYIDGGEIPTYNGTGAPLQLAILYDNSNGVVTLPDNQTYSIDLSSSWTNSTVVPNSIDNKAAPVLNTEALWLDASGATFYAYNGGWSGAIPHYSSQPNELWQFSPNGKAGTWSQVSQSMTSNFSTLSRVQAGTQTSHNGVGYALGGFETSATDLSISSSVLIGGLIVYDSQSQDWFNISTSDYSLHGAARGAAHFVPDYRPEGLLFTLGGVANDLDTLVSLDHITMYEPTTQSWQTQRRSGEAPHPVVNPCAVGISGDNGTYEIFLYGGTATADLFNQPTDDPGATLRAACVYVLTLPAFHWTIATSTPFYGRYFHSCNVIGNRQMISVGGRVATMASTIMNIPPDPWKNGIGIFDMTALEWTDQYNADAASYVTPTVIKAYYQTNGLYPNTWSSNETERWFNPDARTSPKSSNGTSTHSNSPNTNTGAIAGGVVGGVVALLLIAFSLWFFQRRKRRLATLASAKDVTDSGEDKPELEVANRGQGKAELEVDDPSRLMADGNTLYEINGRERQLEAGSVPIHELQGHGMYHTVNH